MTFGVPVIVPSEFSVTPVIEKSELEIVTDCPSASVAAIDNEEIASSS